MFFAGAAFATDRMVKWANEDTPEKLKAMLDELIEFKNDLERASRIQKDIEEAGT